MNGKTGEPREQWFIAFFILAASAYALFTRTAGQIVEDSLPIAIFLAVLSYAYFTMRWGLFGAPRLSIHLILLPTVYLPLLIVALTIVYYGIWIGIRDGYAWLGRQSPPRWFFVTLVGIAVVGVGYLLFLFRLHFRFFFGLTEAVVGLLIGLRNVPTNADPASWTSEIFVLMLTASVFLIVRGFDNMHTGLKPESRDSFLRTFEESEYGTLWRALRRRGENHDES